MAALTVQEIVRAGLGPTYAGAGVSGDTFVNDGRTFLHVKNTNAATRDVTVDSIENCDQGFDHNAVVTVPASTGDRMIGPFPTERFGATCTVSYTATAGVTVAAIKLSQAG